MEPQSRPVLWIELLLLCVLALLWGSSYLFLKVAVTEIPPITLIAYRVSGAAVFLFLVISIRRETLPRDTKSWKMLLIQGFLNSFGAWVLLAWGQQFVDSALTSVLNSTSPIFVFLITVFLTRHEKVGLLKITGAIIGLAGVIMIVGVEALSGLGEEVAGQLAALVAAALYGGAAIYGKRFTHLSAGVTATGTMIWSVIVLVPASLLLEQPWTLTPSFKAVAAATALSILCTGVALLIYFRLVKTLGSLGTASQAYLRAGFGVMLGVIFLGEQISPMVAIGLFAAIVGVAAINFPDRKNASKVKI
ncbi:DMT family transporter [Sneathiella glossodoripedis]|uniref:DMT family transporter n=1 Tax=Sneathiella glossodoripedis TaxID=418853 RepID=UPI000471C109|nr:DMT family transporter [Sneathiella glossodoripedis]